jgi:hypothetical protein
MAEAEHAMRYRRHDALPAELPYRGRTIPFFSL